jgi:hypothetical protein
MNIFKILQYSLLSITTITIFGCGTEASTNNPTKISTTIVDQSILKPRITKSIIISEILAENININLDPDFYMFSDWIELYNNENHPVDISGFYLSDDNDKPKLWKVPQNTIIEANSHLLIWADKKDKTLNAMHTNFKLSHKGETVTLADKQGNIIDHIKFSKQTSNISCTKAADNKLAYMSPTPNKQNSTLYAVAILSKKPDFSPKSGGYTSKQTITLTQEDDASIYYTTDGSIPTLENSTLYKQPIEIDKTTVIRAIAIKKDNLASKPRSQTYFINHQSTLPIVSLKTDAKYLFDDMVGIYVKGKNGAPYIQCKPRTDEVGKVNYAQEWKRPVHLEYFDSTHRDEFSLSLDFEITGQCSRFFDKKSLAFELDSKYDDKTLKYKLFPNKDVSKFKDFKLRPGDYGYKLGDVLAAAIVEDGDLDVDYQAYQAVQMFMNGEFWGIYNLREKKGKDYLKSNYPEIDKNNLDVISHKAKHGDKVSYNKLLNYLKNNDLSQDIHYQEVLKSVDIDNYIDYMSIMIYSANTDWLDTNFRCWKEKKEGAKWRWMLDDMDHGFKNYTKHSEINQNTFNIILNDEQTTLLKALFVNLSNNSTFKTKFKNRFNYLLDTLFLPENMLNITHTLIDERKVDISKGRFGTDQRKFDSHAQRVLDFVQKRRDVVKNQLRLF